MIAVEAQGRLGNHLFQWAFGYATGRALGVPFRFDDTLLRTVFDLAPPPPPPRRRQRLRRRLQPLRERTIDNAEPPSSVLPTLRDRTHYFGFFQSEQYFGAYADEIRARLRVRADQQAAYAAAHGDLRGHVAIHVRRGDYREWRGGVQLPVAWYRECLERVAGTEGREVVVVSDELEAVRAEMGDTSGMRFVPASESVDLQVLLHADVVIASPSSFSWWGAWLNARGPTVLVPERWLGYHDTVEWPRGVVCPGWTEVAVDCSSVAAG